MPDPESQRNQPDEKLNAPSSAPWEALLDRVREATSPRYEVLRLIGYGGMAGVYLAEEPKLGRRVAIKVMAPALMLDPDLVGRFRQEARTIAGLNHPNVITIYDVAEGDDLHYFVMAYLPGRTVGHVMNETPGPLPFDVVGAWLYQIGSALDYAHGFGVVHRDVKPGNLLLDDRGNALVTDFGIAKVADHHGFTRTGMLVGTPSYMSPEQCASGEVGAPSDQYSLGAVAYQMLTGQTPFSGPTLQVLQAHVNQMPRPIREVRPDTPPDVAEAVERMLAKDPRDRWPSLGEALEAIGAEPVGHSSPVRPLLMELAVPVQKVTISADRAVHRPPVPSEDVNAGETFLLKAVVTGSDGRVLRNRVVQWESENAATARVFPDGRVVALGPGTARVAVRCGGARDAVVFEVVGEVEPSHLAPARQVPAGARVSLAEILPAGAPLGSGPDSGWDSTDPGVARISRDGEVEALRPGRATLAAYSGGRAVVAELTVTPIPGSVSRTSPRGTPVPAGTPTPGGGATPGAGGPGAPTATPTPGPLRRPAALAGGALAVVALLAGVAYFALAGDGDPASPGAGSGDLAGPPATDPAGPWDPDPTAPLAEDTTGAAGETDPESPPDVTPDVTPDPQTDPEPTPPPPAMGVVRLQALPPGGRVTVTVSGQTRSAGAGDSLRLPPGSYEARAEAPGYLPFTGRITVTAGQGFDWSPNLQPEPEPDVVEDPDPPEPAGPDIPPGRAEEVRQTLTDFARSFETRNMAEVLRFFPEAPGEWANRWRVLIEDRQNARDLRATVSRMDNPQFDGPDAAEIGFTIQLEYRDIRNTTQNPALAFRAVMERGESGWYFRELREGT